MTDGPSSDTTIFPYSGPPLELPGLSTPYQFASTPFAHQQRALTLSAARPYFALFMEQGTGKTKVLLDNGAALYQNGKIELLIIVTDNNLHRAWIEDELPKHWPPATRCAAFVWDTARAGTKKYAAALAAWEVAPACRILAVNVEALITTKVQQLLHRLVRKYPTMLVVDESTSIKSPSIKRTKILWALGPWAKYRRIATGIPAPESPLNFYAQGRFLHRHFWEEDSYFTFKHRYAVWEQRTNNVNGRRYEVLAIDPRSGLPMFQNQEALMAQVAPHSFRVMKDECLDLPPKLFKVLRFQLSRQQRTLYDELQSGLAQLSAGAGDAPPSYAYIKQVMTRLVRGQQVASGFAVPPEALQGDDPEMTVQWGAQYALPENPRLAALLAELERYPGDTRVLIWARFTYDVDVVCAALEAWRPGTVVRYDGETDADEKSAARLSFQDPASPVRYFVGKSRSGGKGLTLTEASVCIFYSHESSLEARLQSEDRPHRIGQKKNVTIISMEAEGTWDTALIKMLDWKFSNMEALLRAVPVHQWGQLASGQLTHQLLTRDNAA